MSFTKKTSFGLVALAFFCLSAPSPLFAESKSTQSALHFSKGTLAFADQDFKTALKHFEKAYKADPEKPDTLYYLGVTHLRMENYSKASRYFGELLEKHPDFSRAWYEYGLSLFREKKYEEAKGWLEKAAAKEIGDAEPKYFHALSELYLGNREEAKKEFEALLRKEPEGTLAEGAKEWLAQIEKGEKIRPPAEAKKIDRFKVQFGAGYFYDSNVTFDPDTESLVGNNTNQDDHGSAVSMNMNWRAFELGKMRFKAFLNSFQSLYWSHHKNLEFDRFNFGRHMAGGEFTFQFTKDLRLRMPFTYALMTQGSELYLHNGEGRSALEWSWAKHFFTSMQMAIRGDQFFAYPANSAQVRDAINVSARFEQYFFLPSNHDIYFKPGYEFDANIAEGDDWDYWGHKIIFAFQVPLVWKIKLQHFDQWTLARQYQEIDSVFTSPQRKRRDFIYYGLTLLTRDLTPHWALQITHSYTHSDSNFNRYSYKRHIVGMNILLRL